MAISVMRVEGRYGVVRRACRSRRRQMGCTDNGIDEPTDCRINPVRLVPIVEAFGELARATFAAAMRHVVLKKDLLIEDFAAEVLGGEIAIHITHRFVPTLGEVLCAALLDEISP